jgi:1-acyl-sn-glycerol-3-phosphate acyltransferase
MAKQSLARSRAQENRAIRTHRGFNKFLQHTLGRYLDARFNLVGEHLDVVEGLAPPYLVLSNHMAFWDPFIISAFLPEPVSYVTSDNNFRNPVLRFLLGLVGAIPKSKFMSDYETVRHIFRIRDRGGIVGIFPEGRRSWDGHTMPLLYATAKLVKLLRTPVLAVVFKGGFLSMPRWSPRIRTGRLTVSFSQLFEAGDLRRMSVDEIYDRMTTALAYDEYAYQRHAMIPFRGRKRAENMEQSLFACPECEGIGTLRSQKNSFRCLGCGLDVYYNVYGFLEQRKGRLQFDNVRDWNVWQLDYLRRYMAERLTREDDPELIVDVRTLLMRGYRRVRMRKLRVGSAHLFRDRIEFDPVVAQRIVFPLHGVHGTNVQRGEKLEFYHREYVYRFNFLDRHVSSYKWLNAVSILQELTSGEHR